MAEEKQKEPSGNKKKKPVVKKVIGNVQPGGDVERKLPDTPTYEHG